MNVLDLQADPEKFQRSIWIPTGSGPRCLGTIMVPFQAERFELLNPALIAVRDGQELPFDGVWDERSKGGSKDTDNAVSLLWLLFASKHPLRIEVGACDQQQGDEVRQIIKGILRIDKPLNKFLNRVISVQRTQVLNTQTESYISILTADQYGSHGSRPSVVVLDELTHQPDPAFGQTLSDNWDKQRPYSLMLIITNAGQRDSWQETWKENYRNSDRWRIAEFSEPAPWISADALAESERRNPQARFLRLWHGVWSSPGGDALPVDQIDRSIRPDLQPALKPSAEYLYVAGCDLGLTRDRAAITLLGVHRETKRIRLCSTRVWTPPPGGKISIASVEAALVSWHRQFKIRELSYDPWQSEYLAQRLRQDRIRTNEVVFSSQATQQQMASTLLEVFSDQQVTLYPDADLRRDLTRARLVERGWGFKLEWPRDSSGHADLGMSFTLALLSAKAIAGKPIIKLGSWPKGGDWYARFERRQLAYQREHERLQAGGSDPIGREVISAWLRRQGRRKQQDSSIRDL